MQTTPEGWRLGLLGLLGRTVADMLQGGIADLVAWLYGICVHLPSV